MGTRSTPQERATAADADVRAFLAAGDTRSALHRARHALEAEAASLRRHDPARAALLDAALAGSLAQIAATLASRQPRRPPGYTTGPPSAGHLLAAYAAARGETSRGR